METAPAPLSSSLRNKEDKVSHKSPISETASPNGPSDAVDDITVKKLLLKVGFNAIPPLFTLFPLALPGHINIGNARIQGLEAGLGVKRNDYKIALFVFSTP